MGDNNTLVMENTVKNSRADRLSSYDLQDFPKISGSEEEWKFLPLNRLHGLDKAESLSQESLGIKLSEESSSIVVQKVASTDIRIGSAGIPQDRISALAWNSFIEANIVTILENEYLDLPVVINFDSDSVNLLSNHLILVAQKNSSSTIVIKYSGHAVVAENVEIIVEDNAKLTVIFIQDWDSDSVHVSSHYSLLGKKSYLKHISITTGGDLVRINPSVTFAKSDSEVEMYGLYVAEENQFIEQRLFVDHMVANCKSRVTYKGALQGNKAHTVWVGDVLIRKAAEGTDTYELNRNLLLSENARADSVPNLEIETGLIEGAGHASSTGTFDDEQLFYLQSRGVAYDTARKLVVSGFLNEIIQKIGISDIQEKLNIRIAEKLRKEYNLGFRDV